MKAAKVKVISESNSINLEKRINELLKKGWEVTNTLCVDEYCISTMMTKTE